MINGINTMYVILSYILYIYRWMVGISELLLQDNELAHCFNKLL